MSGYVIVGGKRYVNQWAEAGKTYRLVICQKCENDSGKLYDDEDNFEGYCDCRTGEAQRIADGAA